MLRIKNDKEVERIIKAHEARQYTAVVISGTIYLILSDKYIQGVAYYHNLSILIG